MKKSRFPTVYLIIITVLTWIPVFVGILYSFNGNRSSGHWTGFSLKWYGVLLRDRSMREAFLNSVILGVSSSLLGAALSVTAALAFRRRLLKSAGLTKIALMLPIMVPDIILGMGFLAFFRVLHLPFGMLTLIIAHTTFSVPYIFSQVQARLASMNTSEIDASRVLGAGPIRTFFEVTLPYLLPAVFSGMVLSFAMSFDDVIISIFVTGVNVNTLPIKVYTQVKNGVTPEINALCTVMLFIAVSGYLISNQIKRRSSK